MSDAVSPECYTNKQVKARKTHKCCECGGEIKIGETYDHLSGIWDGEPGRFKTCQDCINLRDRLEKIFPNLCYEYEIEHLDQWVFDSEDPAIIKAWLDNRTKRLVKNPQWMIDELNNLTNKTK